MSDRDKKLDFSTRVIHECLTPGEWEGATLPPIYQTATYAFEDAEELAQVASGAREGYFYTRAGHNPNQLAVAQKVAALEGGEDSLVTLFQ